ncbi:hypothetical protein AAVH_39927, partial [Aphelenchoides avenae]
YNVHRRRCVDHAWNGTFFKVAAGSLGTSVAPFLIHSVVCISIMQIRRFSQKIGAELGGQDQ